ncbi:hypothetical protein [Variovorax sp. DXTD-1]|uniref:hypothetical protein n=1 Tax=Variovorax sp. DXTD-1 TaxID=2495592 RepID=UPI000F86B4EC|nr:hypothetical protein [Variovorax sp. DXTD-1]RST54132.1 hypothetical protein EJI00_03120 [Variovorax sp. DXTD-1]
MSSTELATSNTSLAPSFASVEGFELANRIGKAFAASTLVPQQYRDNVANCIVALEMANRMQASPLMVMQNLYIVHGNPGWSSKFLIACFNQSGRFSALRYEFDLDGSKVPYGCRAWAVEKATGERLVGSTVTLDMAKAEGWSTKSGSKWKTMPELMLQYRAAAFFVRVYAPEISMGLQTDDELRDTFDNETGALVEPAGKPDVAPVRRRAAPIPADVIDNESGEITPAADAGIPASDDAPLDADNPAAGADAQAAAAQQDKQAATATKKPQTLGNTILASAGEKKLLINRAKSNDLNMAELIEQAGVGPMDPTTLEGLTADGFVAIKDLLPKAA